LNKLANDRAAKWSPGQEIWRASANTILRPKSPVFRLAWLLTIVVAWTSASPGPPPVPAEEPGGVSEYDVKAAFLFHFAQFVEWPADAFKDVDTPLTYCTVGEDAFHGALDESVRGKTIGNRTLRVRHLKEKDAIDDCQVLFIAAAQKVSQSQELAGAARHPTLTVGETENFASEGGVIGFCLEAKKVRFEVNLEAAGKARLKISARLLTLAKAVLGGPKGN
jgi:hypothetical protein